MPLSSPSRRTPPFSRPSNSFAAAARPSYLPTRGVAYRLASIYLPFVLMKRISSAAIPLISPSKRKSPASSSPADWMSATSSATNFHYHKLLMRLRLHLIHALNPSKSWSSSSVQRQIGFASPYSTCRRPCYFTSLAFRPGFSSLPVGHA